MDRMKIKWEYFNVIDTFDRKSMMVDDVFITINRQSADRTNDHTYDIERALLDYAGEKEFTHQIFQLSIHRLTSGHNLFVEFTPTSIMLGLSIKLRQE